MIVLASLAGGLALGLAHFALAARTVHLWMDDRRSVAAALQIARLIVTAGVFVLIARAGIWALAAAFGGFLVARTVELRRRLP